MDALEEYKNRNKDDKKIKNKYCQNLLSRLLISVIIFLLCLILSNMNKQVNSFIKNDILKKNISFTKISNVYNKYFGKIIPIKSEALENKTVFNEKLTYEKLNDYKDGYELNVSANYLVPVINSGIVVFVGNKEDYGNTIIIQGIDEVDYWYGNIDNTSVSLYDYVSKGTILGTAGENKLYLVFQKNGKYLDYDEVME